MNMSGKDNKQSPAKPEKSWKDDVIQDAKGIPIRKRLLYRDPKRNKLTGCTVIAVFSDLKRFAVTVDKIKGDYKDDDDNWKTNLIQEQFVLPFRNFVKFDSLLIEKDCTPHQKAETIPKSMQDDPYNLDYPLCLVLVGGNARLEAARRLRDLDNKESGQKCVFEIISGRVHYELKEKLFAYNHSLASQKRRDLQLTYTGSKLVFAQDHAWDDTVINALSRNVRWRSKSVELIAELPKQSASIIKFKNGESLLISNDELNENNGSLASNSMSDDDVEQMFEKLQRRLNKENAQKDQSRASKKKNGKMVKRKPTITPMTPKLCIQNKTINRVNPMMTRLATFGSGTISKAYAAQESKKDEENSFHNLSVSSIHSNRNFVLARNDDPDDQGDDQDDQSSDGSSEDGDDNHNDRDGGLGGMPPNRDGDDDGRNNGNNRQIQPASSNESTTEQSEFQSKIKFRLSDIKVRYYGRDKQGNNVAIIKKVKEWQKLVDVFNIPKGDWYNLWTLEVIRGEAKKVQDHDKSHEGNIFKLWQLFEVKFPVPSELPIRISKVLDYKYRGYKTMVTHVTNFVNLLAKIDEDVEDRRLMEDEERLPHNLPTYDVAYDCLRKSIDNVPTLHRKVQELEIVRNPIVNIPSYKRGKADVEGLQESMIQAERMYYPNAELRKKDFRKHDYHFYGPYPQMTCKRNRYEKHQALSNHIRGKLQKRYGMVQATEPKCKACGLDNHTIKECRNKRKRQQWARQNNACFWCLSRDHSVKDCPKKAAWRKAKEEGGTAGGHRQNTTSRGNEGSRNGRGGYRRGDYGNRRNRGRGGPRGRGYGRGRGRGGYRGGHRGGYRGGHRGRHRGGNSRRGYGRGRRNYQQYVQQDDEARTIDGDCEQPQERLAFQRDIVDFGNETDPELENLYAQQFMMQAKINKIKAKKKQSVGKQKEKQLMQSSDEFYDMNYHGVTWSQIPENDTTQLRIGRKYDEGYVKEHALIDSGSSISTVTPHVAKKLIESTEYKVIKGIKKFKVENGGQTEEVFSGNYLKLPVQIINSNQWVNIKFYIMPHNHCLFGMILGLSDMKNVGYDIATRMSDGMLIFKHSAARKKINYIESNQQIFEKCEQMGDEFHCYQIVQKENVFSMHQSKEREQKDSEESDDDGRGPSHQF